MNSKIEQVRENFDRHAAASPTFARCQKHVAKRLVQMLMTRLPNHACESRIADLGSGAGYLTSEIFDTYPGVSVDAVDISPHMNMVMQTRAAFKPYLDSNRLTLHQADIDEVIPALGCKHYFSSLALQWIPDLRKTFTLISDQLPPGGVFAFSIMTDHTFRDLRACFEHFDAHLPGPKLLGREVLMAMIADAFTIEDRSFEKWVEVHNSPADFLHQLHATGSVNPYGERVPLSLMRNVLRYYSENFMRPDGKVSVLYSVAYFICRKKDYTTL